MNPITPCSQNICKNLVIALLVLLLVITTVELNQYNDCLDHAWEDFKQLALSAVEQFQQLIGGLRLHTHFSPV